MLQKVVIVVLILFRQTIRLKTQNIYGWRTFRPVIFDRPESGTIGFTLNFYLLEIFNYTFRVKIQLVVTKVCSVADPGCLSRIPDPDFYPSRIPDLGSRIPDPKTATKERWKKISCHTFLCSHKFHKIVNYFSFEVPKKKIWANFQRFLELFTKKIVKKLWKIWSWDPGSEIRDPEKTYSGSRIQGSKSTRSRIPDPDPQHWKYDQHPDPHWFGSLYPYPDLDRYWNKIKRWICIRIKTNADPQHWSLQGWRAKMTHKSRNFLKNFMFWSVGWPLLRVEDFFCNLYVLYGGPGIGKL